MSVYLGTQLLSGIATNTISNAHDLFDFKWIDHELSDQSWLNADTFSWQDGTVYADAYNHLENDYTNGTAASETIGSYTINYILAPDGHKIVMANNESTVADIYSESGVAWYYVLDRVNDRFKLPRTKYGFVGLRDSVGKYVPESLPNHNHVDGFAGVNETSSFGATTTSAVGNINQQSGTSTNYHAYTSGALSSSSAYQDNAPVQQRATQMYLYFYVGQFSQTATEQTAGLNSELFNGKLDLDLGNITNVSKETIVGWGMPDYTRGVTFSGDTAIQAPYDCVVFWNTSASTGNPAYFMISQTGAFTTEHLTFPYYANADGFQTRTFLIPKGWYFKTTRNYEIPTSFSPSQYFPMKGV